MNKMRIFSLTLISFFIFNLIYAQKNYLKYVDPYIGSGGHGHVFVGASAPFGAIQVGPNNTPKGWDWCSGYHYSDSIVIGFSHTHMTGGGCGDLGDILMMPYPKPQTGVDVTKSWSSGYSHDNELVKPNYYSLSMENGVKVELTATERAAMHKYTFPRNETPNILIDLKNGVANSAYDTKLKLVDKYTIEGYRFVKGFSPDRNVYFTIKSERPIKGLFVYENNMFAQTDSVSGKGIIGMIEYESTDVREVKLKVAISSVSSRNAFENLTAEMPAWNFENVKKLSAKKWNTALSKIEINADNETQKRIFYTAMYHTMVAPTLYGDVNGQFSGHDKKIYNGTWDNYSTFSLWDTYRAHNPIATIIHPDKIDDFVNSFLSIYNQQGKLPIWPLVGAETECMVGNPSISIISDAILKGIKGFDKNEAYEKMKKTAMMDERGMIFLKEYGYIPFDKEHQGLSKCMEYAIADWALAQVALKLGKTEDYKYFLKRSKSYVNYFDKSTNFMRGLSAQGNYRVPFNPFESIHSGGDYTEGNAWQYTWLVPHDVEGLISLFGNEQNFVQKLDSLFIVNGYLGDGASLDISGLIGQYAHGNEPSHHVIYLYPFVGQQWKTAEKARYIMNNFYTDKPDGIIGNEDCGQMSAWYILSALGFYQVNPCNGMYVFGSPLFKQAKVNMPNGKIFRVNAKNNNDTNIYIQSVTLNGKPYTKSYIMYEDILKGGTLEFVMGNNPNSGFGAAKINRPFN